MCRKKKKVLIIDDQEKARELLDVTLRKMDLELFKSSNCSNGIRIAKSELPDLILLDNMMPEIDGITTCKILKRNPITSGIPIVFLTAKGSRLDVKVALEAGGEDYIVNLLETIQNLVR